MQMPEKTASDLAEASQVSAHETDYELIRHIHETSSTAVEWPLDVPEMQDHLGLLVKRPQAIWAPDGWSQAMPYPETVFRRRSKRDFLPTQICAADFGRLLKLVCVPCDEGEGGQSAGRNAVSVGFLAGNIEGLKPGFYLLAREARSMSLVLEGLLTSQMARVCLEQAWLGNSALHFIFLTNLERLEATWGPRGYRYAMLAAGRLGQRIYLGATALGLGCCGIGAFYDKEAARLLGVNAATKMVYLVAVGPVKK
jgi:SagB-type dehydrogenase family enzyme